MAKTEHQLSICRRLHGMLECDEIVTSEQFQKTFSCLKNECAIPSSQIARALSVEAGKIDKWVRGENVPNTTEWKSLISSALTLLDNVLELEN